jgi:hypothetical protein
VGLERGPLSFVRIIEELLEWKISGSGLENWDYGCGDPLRWPRDILYPQKLALASLTSGGRSLGRYSSLADYKPRSLVFFYQFCKKKIPVPHCDNTESRKLIVTIIRWSPF